MSTNYSIKNENDANAIEKIENEVKQLDVSFPP